MLIALLCVAAYLLAGVLFARSISGHIVSTAYADDDALRMAVQLGAGSFSMRLPMLLLIIGWLPASIFGIISAKFADITQPRYRVFPTQ